MAEQRDDMLELDACLARVPMPEQLEARIVAATTVRTVGPSPARRSLAIGLAFAAGVVLTLIALRNWPNSSSAPAAAGVDRPALPEQHGDVSEAPAPGLALISEACEWSRSDQLLRFEAGCRIRLAQPAMELEIWAPTRLQPLADGVAVHEGELMFSVEHVDDPHTPARVAVSGGTIEVLGTRFAVHQARDAGHVDLFQGAIQFRQPDGEIQPVEPGRRFRWSSASSSPSSDAIDEPAPRPREPAEAPNQPEPAEPASTLAEGLAEVARLRRAGDLDAAIARLDDLAREQSDSRTLEVISYERGTLVERSTTGSAACEYWSGHRRSFPDGRYHDDVTRRLEQLQCLSK